MNVAQKKSKLVIRLTRPIRVAIVSEDSPTTKFALSTKDCFNKGWVSSPDGSLQKSVDEIISSIQTSISDCLRIFRLHANDADKTSPADYVAWRFGDSRRISAAKFTKYSSAAEQQYLPRAKQAKKSMDAGTGRSSPSSQQSSESGSLINVPPKPHSAGSALLYRNLGFVAKSVKRAKWALPGSDSKHSKLLQGAWAADIPTLRVCTSSGVDSFYYSSGQLAMLICRDPVTYEVSNGFVYAENGAMLATCSQGIYITCYKPNGTMWFHATTDGGSFFDHVTDSLKNWTGSPPWNNKNVLELQLNRIIALRFKGLSNFTLIYRSQIDNLYINVTPPEESEEIIGKVIREKTEEEIAPVAKSEELRKKCGDLNLPEISRVALLETYLLKSKFLELRAIQKNISAIFKKTDTLFSAFFHMQFSKDAAAIVTETIRTSPKLEYPTLKVRETIICPLILRQQIIYQKNRLEAAAAQGLEVKPSLTTKTWLQCNCGSQEIPVLSDVECQEYIENRAPSKQMLIVCITNSKIGMSDVEEMLSDIYHAQNRKHKKPCIQLPLDSYRLLKYDIATAVNGTERMTPWLVEKYNVVDSMVMMFLKSRLLFCNFNFNGYGFDQHNFLKQIRRSFELSRRGRHLPSDFKFGSSFLQPVTEQLLSEEPEVPDDETPSPIEI